LIPVRHYNPITDYREKEEMHQKDLFFRNIQVIEQLDCVDSNARRIIPEESLAFWPLRHYSGYQLFYSLEGDKACLYLKHAEQEDLLYEQRFPVWFSPNLFVLRLVELLVQRDDPHSAI